MLANVGCSPRLHRQIIIQDTYKIEHCLNGVDGVYTLRNSHE